jgi:hypothetical protein
MHICLGHFKQRVYTRDATIPDHLLGLALPHLRDGQKLWLEIDTGRHVVIYNESELALACRAVAEYHRALRDLDDDKWVQETANIWEKMVFPLEIWEPKRSRSKKREARKVPRNGARNEGLEEEPDEVSEETQEETPHSQKEEEGNCEGTQNSEPHVVEGQRRREDENVAQVQPKNALRVKTGYQPRNFLGTPEMPPVPRRTLPVACQMKQTPKKGTDSITQKNMFKGDTGARENKETDVSYLKPMNP